MGFPGSTVGKMAADTGDLGSIPGLGRSSGEGNGNLFQYSCLENSMNREAQWTIVHGAAGLGMTKTTHTHIENGKNLMTT